MTLRQVDTSPRRQQLPPITGLNSSSNFNQNTVLPDAPMASTEMQSTTSYDTAPATESSAPAVVVKATGKSRIKHFLDSKFMMVIMAVATLWALFGFDIYMISQPPKDMDFGAYVVTFVVFLLFAFEWALLSWVSQGYLLSFFFWLDLVAWLSLIPDILVLFQSSEDIQTNNASSQLTVARAGRAARAGTRAARIIRILKLLSIVNKQKQKGKRARVNPEDGGSKIGTKLADVTTQKVIVIVALMLVVTALMELIDTSDRQTWTTEALMWEKLYSEYTNHSDPVFQAHRDNYVKQHIKPGRPKLRVLQIRGERLYYEDPTYLRSIPNEVIKAKGETAETFILLDNKQEVIQTHITNFLQMIVIVLLLGTVSLLFSRDSQTLVIGPLEKMANMLREVTQDPLSAIEDDEEGQGMETDFVQVALKKFVRLVQIAFGEAGANIIKKNLDSGRELDAMVPGEKMRGIFGFCDIRNFTDCTECLQERVMVFVNRIAEYVHWSVKVNYGAPNKNIGDAFLLAWKLPVDDQIKTNRADHALASFIKIVNETSSCPELKALTDDPAIQRRIPGYATRMGFGLHIGWAIEGAIGSILKIDASYLSPHVNMAARLEAATKQYGVLILMTDTFVDALSPGVRSLCRRIDKVTVKGSIEPMELYTYDVNVRAVDLTNIKQEMPAERFFQENPPRTSEAHRKQFAIGVQAYLDGNWAMARDQFETCLKLDEIDHPSKTLLGVMQEQNFSPPPGWNGYRELTEK